ncbi:hypothetical protein [Phytopseudomonas daroniae]|uniref:hypothetical protein n=1 Tax=Phytopseudomonas daroniae TaxID=2487519 RepID=UPI00103850F6|nr:hypothetical protein [Pseudomonas daroniae]TBU73291.1 hypothetical protein DNK10_18675 [Pseudomonas daroniae]
MTVRTTAQPLKTMEPLERQVLKIAGIELAQVVDGGAQAQAVLLEIVASWHGHRSAASFHDFGRAWLLEGNTKSKTADRLLRALFGLEQKAVRSRA